MRRWSIGLALGAALIAPAPVCGQLVQPGAPGQPPQPISAEAAVVHARAAPSAADVAFMQGMIAHHAQALEMVALARTRTSSPEFLLMTSRIDTSQRDEIKMMQDWLRGHHAAVPDPADPHAHHGTGAALMPGMLTPAEMRELADASGPAFERRFLELMIQHHAGALTMVKTLLDAPGGASTPDVFGFATDVDADQRMEIDRMRAMLGRR